MMKPDQRFSCLIPLFMTNHLLFCQSRPPSWLLMFAWCHLNSRQKVCGGSPLIHQSRFIEPGLTSSLNFLPHGWWFMTSHLKAESRWVGGLHGHGVSMAMGVPLVLHFCFGFSKKNQASSGVFFLTSPLKYPMKKNPLWKYHEKISQESLWILWLNPPLVDSPLAPFAAMGCAGSAVTPRGSDAGHAGHAPEAAGQAAPLEAQGKVVPK